MEHSLIPVIVTVICNIGALGCMTGIIINRITNVEHKLDRFEDYNLPSRVAVVENSLKSLHKRLDEIKDEIERN